MKRLFLLGFVFSALLNLVGQDVDDVIFSTERGFYSGPFSVALSADVATANVYFTLDGSDPTPPNGIAYLSPIIINETSTLRAVAVSTDDTTKVFTHSYLFLDDVLNQMGTPPGYPSMWDGYPADYDMNQSYIDTIGDALMMSAMTAIPSLSITMDFDDLFGQADGIYLNTLERGYAWERANSLELIDTDGSTIFHVNSGIRMHGSSSRDPGDYKKHALRAVFRDEYGPERLKVPIFGPEGTDRINGLIMRMVANFSPHDVLASRRSSPQFMKDQWVREAFSEMGHVSADGMFAHVYLNGIYWGVYNIHERPDGAFLEENLGGDQDTYDVLNSGNSVDGNDNAWKDMHEYIYFNLNSESTYDSLLNWIDMENYADYLILNHYGNNSDWGDNNWYAARNRVGNDLWRFYPWDSEFFFQNNYNFTREVVFNKGISQPYKPGFPFHHMKYFKEFKMLFSDRVECNCYGDGILEPSNAIALYNDITNRLDPALLGEYARWGDVSGSFKTYEDELETRQIILTDYLLNSRNSLVTLYNDKGVISPLKSVIYSSPSGLVSSNTQISLNSPDGALIFYTTDGSDPRMEGGSISLSAQLYNGPISISGLTEISARAYDASSLEWSAMCPKVFYTPQNYSDIVINEIHYNPTGQILGMDTVDGDEFEYIELKNTGALPVDISHCSLRYGVQYDFPFGTVMAPGSFLVIAENRIYFDLLYGFDPIHQYSSKLSNGGETIQLLDPFKTEIDRIDYDDISPWPTFADGSGLSLSLAVGANNGLISSWTSETAALTPLAENQFCAASNWTAQVNNPSGCASEDGSVAITFPGPGYSLTWDHGPSSAVLSNMAAGVYPFTVVDPLGCVKSDTIFIEPAVIPSAISGLNLVSFNDNSAIFTWTAMVGISDYQIAFRKVGDSTWNYGSPIGSFSILNNLDSCTEYEVQVSSECSGLLGPASSIITFTTEGCILCSSPAGLYDFNITSFSAIVAWDLLVGASSYTLKYREVGSATWIDYTTTLPIVVLIGIPSCTDYEWTLETTCADGSSALSTSIGMFSTSCKDDILSTNDIHSPIHIYPNPVNDLLNIQYSDSAVDKVYLDVLNLNGQNLHSEVMSCNEGMNQWSIDVQNLPSGEYILRLKSSSKTEHKTFLVH